MILGYRSVSRYGMIDSDSCVIDNMRNDLEQTIERKLKGVHTNRICQTADGRYKTHHPQIIKRTRLDLLIALYEYYYHDSPQSNRKAPTIKNIYPKWMEHFEKLVEQGHRGVGSIRHYKSDYRKFLEGSDIEKVDMRTLKHSDIKNFYSQIAAGEAITRQTLNNAKTLINQIFDFARDRDIPVINTHDIKTMDLCCKETDNTDKVYSDEERDAVLEACKSGNDVYARCIGLMFCLCVRIGEIKALKWSDVDFENKRVFVHRSMVQSKENSVYSDKCVDRTKGKKKKCNRFEQLSELAIFFLKQQRTETAFNEYVFMTNGHPLTTNMINKKLKKLCAKAGVEYLSSHKIRFWAVTAMYNQNLPDYVIQYTAGHANPATTQHYKRIAKVNTDINEDAWAKMFG